MYVNLKAHVFFLSIILLLACLSVPQAKFPPSTLVMFRWLYDAIQVAVVKKFMPCNVAILQLQN